MAFWQNVSESDGAFLGRDREDYRFAKNSQFKPLGYRACHEFQLNFSAKEFEILGKAYMNGTVI